MSDFFDRISRPGFILALLGAVLLSFSLKDTLVSFKPARSFDTVLEEGAAAGDHVAGKVPYLLDSFATLETWTENKSTNSRTPAKTSARYYVLPAGEGYVGLSVRSTNFSAASDLVDQTYAFFTSGTAPASKLELDTRVVPMEEELAELFRQDLREYYDLSDAEIDAMGTPLMVEPRAFGTIRAFCGVGSAVLLLGLIILAVYWRKIGKIRAQKKARAAAGPEIG